MAFICDVPAVPTVQVDDGCVKITRWDFAPGAVTGWHTHAWPYVVVMLVDGTLSIHDGKTVTDVPLKAGQSYRRLANVQHDVKNGSHHPIAFIEIEIMRPDKLDHLPA
jgi:quercetin dioxygenase-like cupin family protein